MGMSGRAAARQSGRVGLTWRSSRESCILTGDKQLSRAGADHESRDWSSVTEPHDGRPVRRPMAADLVAAVFTAVLLITVQLVDVAEPWWLRAISVALLLVAAIFISFPFFHLSRHGKSGKGDPYFFTTEVVDKGLYEIVRHPQYLGYTLLVIGFAGLDPHPLVLGLAAGAVVFLYVQSVLEERSCCEKLGSEYRAYMEKVPRFNIPLGLFRMAKRRRTAGALD